MLDESLPLRIAIYGRVSTDEQARGGYSIADQLDKLRGYVGLRDPWTIAGEYIDDGYTGKNIRRPGYKRLFEEINEWDAILVMKMDRIHRKVSNALKMFEKQLEKNDKYFISFTENIDTSTAGGRAMMIITLVFAQLESEQTGERTYSGMKQKVKQKGYPGHEAPTGFIAIKEIVIDEKTGKAKTKSHLEPVPEDLEIVKQIYNFYNDGFSMPQIVRKLKNLKFKAGRNKDISYSKVHCILKNPIYAGYYKWHDIIVKFDAVKPVISPTLFNLCQKRKCSEADRGDYKPLILKEVDFYKVPREKIKEIPAVHRGKHNLSC